MTPSDTPGNGLEQVWIQNLRGFIKGEFAADEKWKAIFLDQISRLQQELAEARAERDRLLEKGLDLIKERDEAQWALTHEIRIKGEIVTALRAAEAREKQVRAETIEECAAFIQNHPELAAIVEFDDYYEGVETEIANSIRALASKEGGDV